MRASAVIPWICLLLPSRAVWGQSTVTAHASTAEVDSINTTNVTQRVDTFSTELRARIGNGSFLYDQTFNVAFSDPQVQNAITAARSVLAGAGAVNFTNPTQVSSSTSQVSSNINTVTTGTSSQVFVTTMVFVGPQTIPTGNLGICQSFVPPANGNNVLTLAGCVPGGTPFSIVAGGVDVNTLTFSLVTINKTATTTNTFLNTQVYEVDGFPAGGPSATPAPPSLILALTGLAGAGLYLATRKFRHPGV